MANKLITGIFFLCAKSLAILLITHQHNVPTLLLNHPHYFNDNENKENSPTYLHVLLMDPFCHEKQPNKK